MFVVWYVGAPFSWHQGFYVVVLDCYLLVLSVVVGLKLSSSPSYPSKVVALLFGLPTAKSLIYCEFP